MSERVRTLRALRSGSSDSNGDDDDDYDLGEVQNDLMTKLVELSSIESVSSTAIRVSWRVPDAVDARALSHVEGYFVRFRDMSGGSQKFNMKTVMRDEDEEGERDGGCTISNLRKFTEYEVFVTPFFRRLEGQPSNSLHVQTLEDAPSAPPSNVRIEVANFTSAEIKWAPPPPQHRNGVLLGYQVHVKGNNSAFHSNLTLNATTTHFVLSNLTLNGNYVVRACAFTAAGNGPFSQPAAFAMDPALVRFPLVTHSNGNSNSSAMSEIWFVAILLGVVVVILALVFVGIVVYRKRWGSKHRSKSLAHLTSAVPVAVQHQHYEARRGDEWGSWKDKNDYAEGQDLYAEVKDVEEDRNNDLMANFNGYARVTNGALVNEPAPYATTTLAMQNNNNRIVRTVVSSLIITILRNNV